MVVVLVIFLFDKVFLELVFHDKKGLYVLVSIVQVMMFWF